MANVVPAVSFRLSPEDYDLWGQIAHSQGLTEGTYAKMLCMQILNKHKGVRPMENYNKETEDLLAKTFISEERLEANKDKEDIMSDDEDLVFVEEAYVGETESAEFRELNNMDDDELWGKEKEEAGRFE